MSDADGKDADGKKERVADAIHRAEQELAEKGPTEAIRDDMSELKAGIKRALSREDSDESSQEPDSGSSQEPDSGSSQEPDSHPQDGHPTS